MDEAQKLMDTLLDKIEELEKRITLLESDQAEHLKNKVVDSNSDGTVSHSNTTKRLTVQKRSGAPSNAAYIVFSNNPSGDDYYIVLEDS